MVIFYKKWKKYNEIQLTKNKMDLNIRKMTNHPLSPASYCLDIQLIYLDIQVNTEISLPRSNLDSSSIPIGPPPVDNFFTIDLTKNIIKNKRCRIQF